MSRIVQLSDTHIVAPGRKAYGVVDTESALRRMVTHINALPELTGPIDAVILTGDLTDHGTDVEYAHLAALLGDLALPLHAIPGNHDRREPMRAAFSDSPLMPGAGPINWRLELDGFDVIGLDTLVEGEAHGVLSDETIDWLDGQLAGTPERPALIALHHPPFDTGITYMDARKLQNPDPLLEIAAAHIAPVQIVCGHVHRHITTLIDGIPMMIAPAPAHAVTLNLKPGDPVSLTKEPGGVLLHEWHHQHDQGCFISRLSLAGPFDGTYPFDDPDAA